jgi:hypothetical protein
VTEIYRALGDDPNELAHLVAEGLLRPLVGDVYISAHTEVDDDVRAAALAMLMPAALADGDAVAAWETAAWLIADGPAPTQLDVYVPAHRSRRRFRGLLVHEALLDPRDVGTIGRIQTTTPARTAADLCRSRPTDVALPLLDRLRAATRIAPREVLAVLNRLSRHRGVPHGRHVVEVWAARLGAGQSLQRPVTR